jgi:acylglycerol lipase
MLSTFLTTMETFRRRQLIGYLSCLALLLLQSCASYPILNRDPPPITSGYFTVQDGTRLPYRVWSPAKSPSGVILALHGMNDSRDAWEYPASTLMAAGMAVYSPDQRGFGATSTRGLWPGSQTLVNDARAEANDLHMLHPNVPLYLMAESMGAAVLMVLATEPDTPSTAGYILVAPAVWARSEMSFPTRALLWLVDELLPSLRLTGRGFVKVTASDNRDALIRLSTDPLTIQATRVDAIKGLVDLMDRAAAAAPHVTAPTLILYGGRDELIPPEATAATWRALPPTAVRAFYPNGYHLLLRDNNRIEPIGDILSWIGNQHVPLPSGADEAASTWLKQQDAAVTK